MTSKYLLNFFLILISIFCNGLAQDDENSKKIFCVYLTHSANRADIGKFDVNFINPRLCTHLIYAYFGVDDDGTIKSINSDLDFGQDNIKKFNNLKQLNPSLKTIAAVGGWDWSERSPRYSEIFQSSENQQRFAESAVKFLKEHKFDGLLFHWAYPGLHGGNDKIDKYSHSLILQKLRAEFKKDNFLVIAMCDSMNIDKSYVDTSVINNVDYVLVTSYEFYGPWSNHIGIASGLYLHPDETYNALSVHSAITNWLRRTLDSEKIIMGIPLFGRAFTLQSKELTEPGSAFKSAGEETEYSKNPGLISYMELCTRIRDLGWTVKWEDTQKNPYAFKSDQWVSFENERSLEFKVKYVKEKNLGGVAAVFIEDDDFRGICGPKNPLLTALNNYFRLESDDEFEYILNVYVFKKNIKNQYTQCVYHTSEKIRID